MRGVAIPCGEESCRNVTMHSSGKCHLHQIKRGPRSASRAARLGVPVALPAPRPAVKVERVRPKDSFPTPPPIVQDPAPVAVPTPPPAVIAPAAAAPPAPPVVAPPVAPPPVIEPVVEAPPAPTPAPVAARVEDAPLVEHMPNGDVVETYYRGSEITREDGPAKVVRNRNGDLVEENYFRNGRLHRDDGPAVVDYRVGKIVIRGGVHHPQRTDEVLEKPYEVYYRNGVIHREDGPAMVIGANGKERWFVDGTEVNVGVRYLRRLAKEGIPLRTAVAFAQWDEETAIELHRADVTPENANACFDYLSEELGDEPSYERLMEELVTKRVDFTSKLALAGR